MDFHMGKNTYFYLADREVLVLSATPMARKNQISNPLLSRLSRAILPLFAFLLSLGGLPARDGGPTVGYSPQLQPIEGDQPVVFSYNLEITSPPNVAVGSNQIITPVPGVVTAPSGVSVATALSFVSLSPTSLVFTGPHQTQTITVSLSVPLGTAAGDYSWSISTSGWPAGTIDPFAFINAKVTIPQIPDSPAVNLTAPIDGATFVYNTGGPPLTIPLAFTATAPAVSPIISVDADLNGLAVPVSSSGLGTGSVSANGVLTVTSGGLFTVRARATNGVGTSEDTAEFTVIVENTPPPPPPPPPARCGVNWLPPISLGKVQKGGSTVAIKFELDCGCEQGADRDGDGDPDHYPGQRTKSKDKVDPTIVVAISEVLANGSVAPPVLFSHNPHDKASGYAIKGGDMYHLNFRAAPGPHRYLIEVFHFPAGAPGPQVIGTKEFTTK